MLSYNSILHLFQGGEEPLSIFTKWAFKNKSAVSLMTILVLAIGIVSYFRLPMEFLPSADNPQVTIISMGHGTDSKTMEAGVTTPIEQAVTGIKGKSQYILLLVTDFRK